MDFPVSLMFANMGSIVADEEHNCWASASVEFAERTGLYGRNFLCAASQKAQPPKNNSRPTATAFCTLDLSSMAP